MKHDANGHSVGAKTSLSVLPSFAPDAVMAALNGIPAAVGYWDDGLRNKFSNDAYLGWFGFTPAQMVDRHIREVMGDTLFELNLPYITEALAGERQTFDRELVAVDGRKRQVQVSYIPDERDGVIHGFVVLATDITTRVDAEHRLQESADRYRALARNMPSGFVLLFDTELLISVADGIELAAFGFTRESLEGKTLHEAFPPHLAAEVEPHYRAALRGETVSWERVVAERTFRLTAAPVDSDLGTVSSGIVVAVDVSEERRNERSWVALHSIATEVARKASPNDIAALIAHTLQDVFAVDITAVVRFTGPGSGEILAMAPQHLETLGRTVSFAVGDASAIARVVETGQVSTVRYVTSGGRLSEAITAAGMQVGAAAPIHDQGELWGAIVLASSLADGLTDDVVARLASFADLVELAVGNSEAWSALSREAATDELTGLPNRRSFYEQLRREIERAQRHQRPLSVVLMDIDHFKAVNDRFGHHAGDRVLAELGTLMRQVMREGELMARIGGEEFGWIVPETDADAAMGAAERLRTAVGSETFSSVGEMTMSAGVCSLSQVADLDALVGGADQALYAAKREGRNRTSRFQTRSDDRS